MRAWLFLAPTLVSCSARIDDPNVGAVPVSPDASETTSSGVATFAMSALFLGDLARDGGVKLSNDPNVWAHFGYDIDGRVTIATSPDVCIPASNNFTDTWIDGDDGIDNAFGAGILPVIEDVTGPTPTASATSLITQGAWTMQMRVTGLSGDVHQTATGLAADTFISGAYGAPVAFDTSTIWPVRASTRLAFDTVYVDDGVVVLRDAEGPLVLPVQLSASKNVTLSLIIRVPIVTFALADGAGTIAGVITTADAEESATELAVQLGSCAYVAFAVDGNADILADGGNAPGVPCDAISIGLGFTARQIGSSPETGIDPLPLADACAPPDAGSGDADAD